MRIVKSGPASSAPEPEAWMLAVQRIRATRGEPSAPGPWWIAFLYSLMAALTSLALISDDPFQVAWCCIMTALLAAIRLNPELDSWRASRDRPAARP